MTIQGLFRNKILLAGIAAILGAAVVTGAVIIVKSSFPDVGASVDDPSNGQKLASGDITLEPLIYDSAGVEPDSGFKIKVNKNIGAGQLKTALSVRPDREFSIRSVSKNEFELNFAEPLESDSIYRFELNGKESAADFSWAFQTKKEFRVLRTLPRDKGIGVPVHSGIEITFSHEGMEDLGGYFEITPKVSGRFEYHKKVAVFVPEGLEYGTVYTVKLKKGLGLSGSSEKISEDTVFQFQTQPQENTRSERYFNFSEAVYNFTAGETPTLTVYGDDYYRNNNFTVEVYGYEDAESFIRDLKKYDETPYWAQRSSSDGLFDKSKLEKLSAFETRIMYIDSPWYLQVLQFPDKLPEGYYFVSVTLDGQEYCAHMQVNNLSVYLMTENDKSLLWVNNAKTGAPEQNVTVKVDGVKGGVTDSQGIARFDGPGANETEKEGSRYFLLEPRNGAAFAARVSGNSSYGQYGYYGTFGYDTGNSASRKYWSYLYLDRGMYLTDDTIRLWGLAKPRDAEVKTDKVTVELMKYTYDSYSDRQSVLVSKELELTPYGTYTGELSYENFNPGSYYVVVRSGENTLEQTYVEVSDYIKPSYKLDVSQDKKICFIGERVEIGVQASFFEGSPVSRLELNYDTYGGSEYMKYTSGSISCGSDGKASYNYVPEALSGSAAMDWKPLYSSVSFQNAGAEEENVRASASIHVFPRDIMIDVSGKLTDGKISIHAKTNKIDISKLEQQPELLYDYDNDDYRYRGAPTDAAFRVRVIESRWEKEAIGQYYDFINKVTRNKYRYFEVKKTVGDFELSTVNGAVEHQIAYDGFSNYSSYYMEITGADSRGRPIRFTEYIYNSNLYGDYLERMEMSRYYSLAEANKTQRFKTGEQASLRVLENEKEYAMPQNGRILYLTMRNGLVDYSVKNTSLYERTFDKELIPNAFVKAVYFDGTNTYNAGSFGLYYDYTEKALHISLEPDREQYRPGDTVKMGVSVKDADGNPCAAEVNLSVVDEAFFALRDQSVDTAAGVYSYVFDTGITNEYISYTPIYTRYPYAECGEGGDAGSVRSDFKDNAFFGSVTTDNRGKGSMSFRLPDNLTSWRVTGQGLTQDLKAGNTRLNINAKLPFFTTLIFNDIYLAGDSPGISLRSYGTEVTDNGAVKYEVTVEGTEGYKKSFSKEQKANEYCNISLNSLEAGDYSITVSAVYGSHRDAVRKDFRVADSLLETARIEYFEVSDGTDIASGLEISSENQLVELSFYIKNLSRYNRVLNSLNYSWGQRVDQVLARKLAAEHLKKYFGREALDADDVELTDYQTGDGGIALLTYDSPNPELSAKISSLGSEYFNKSDLEGYFVSIAENDKSANEDIAASYFGLASLGRPVLLDVRAFLKEESISLKEKLYLGMALAELGDHSGARAVYDGILKDYGKAAGELKYIDQGKDSDDIVELTSLCSLIAMKLHTPEKDAFFDYVTSKSTNDMLVNLEKLIYLQNTVPEAEKTGSLKIDTGGAAENFSLAGTDRKTLTVTYDTLKKMKLSDVNGDIECAAKFIGPLSAVLDGSDSLMGISRVYKVKGAETTGFKHSDLVEVQLTVNLDPAAPEGHYQITDVLPSGLRFVSPANWNWERWYWEVTNGQKVIFGYNYSQKLRNSDTISYYARVVSTGSYTADDAVVKHVKSQACSFSGRKTVEIGED